MRINLFTVFILFIVFSSCNKEEAIVTKGYRDTVISGNTPPPFSGVTTTQVRTYVNKMYIDLIGREPDPAELQSGIDQLINAAFSEASRIALISKLQADPAYFRRVFEVNSANLTNSADSSQIAELIGTFTFVRLQQLADGNVFLANAILLEIDKLQKFASAEKDYRNETISINVFYDRFLQNNIYDEINMGTENFVKSCFENLLHRNPTVEELKIGGQMVDGTAGVLFLKNGASKGDFVNIITNSQEFHEALVVDAYKNLLLRSPSSIEMTNEALPFINTHNFKKIQENIIKSREYAGF